MCYASRVFLQIAQLSVLNKHTEFHHHIFRGYGDIRCFTRYVTADELFSRYILLVRAQCAVQINLYLNVLTSGTLAIRLGNIGGFKPFTSGA